MTKPMQDQDETIRALQKEIKQIAMDHGFMPKPWGDEIALIHSEVTEAYEAYRMGYKPETEQPWAEVDGKPCGVWSEIADVVIRCLGAAEDYNVDLATIIRWKMEYNRRREYMHGKII